MNIETLLREATHAHAGEVGPTLRRVHDLASVARWRARRRRTRQLIAGVATVAGVVVAAVTVPQLVGPALEPPPLVLAEAGYTLPAFPYTPGWLPDGVAEPNVQLWSEIPGWRNREVVLEHEAIEGLWEFRPVLVQVRVIEPGGPDDYRSGDLPTEDVSVRGVPGVLNDDGFWLSVIWTDPAGRLVLAGASERAVGRDGLLRYVEELVEQPLPATPPVDLAIAPVGSEVTDVQPYYMDFDLPGGRQLTLTVHDPAKVDGMQHDLLARGPDFVPALVVVEVAGRRAELADNGEGALALSISFAPDLMLTIGPWSGGQENLLAIAEGATLTPYARPAPIA
jgi:hypothetical protein